MVPGWQGLQGAVTNNTIGVASLGWNIKLLTYQPPSIPDNARTILAQKIKDAADAEADAINLSFKTIKTGFTSCSFSKSNSNINGELALEPPEYYYNWDYLLVRDAITYAVGKNSVVIASAGNQNGPIGFDQQPCESIPYPCYPAQYSNVIAVSGSQQNNNFVDDWNYGSFIDVNAPGRTDANTGLWSTDLNDSYTNDVAKTSGTSFAAPQVSALASLIKSLNVSLTPDQIQTILENTADKVGQYSYTNGRNDYFGYGRINAYEAVKEAIPTKITTDITDPPSTVTWDTHVLVRKPSSGVDLYVDGVTLTIDAGAVVVVEKQVRLKRHRRR